MFDSIRCDYIRCDYPLPDGYEGHEFQTKDTPRQSLEQYTITAAGRLMLDPFAWFQGEPGFEGPPAPRDQNYHGMLRFYCHAAEWHEYIAKFTDGQLVAITDVSGGTV